MKKIAKLSLVAAVAVAGLTNVNAASLEEAIKGVDVSGKVYVETLANDNKLTDSNNTQTDIDVDLTLKSKVNDNITAVVRIQADQQDDEDVTYTNQNVDADNIYFTYTNGALAVNAGKQDMNTPTTDGEVGTGVIGTYNLGMATVAAGYLYDHTLAAVNGSDIGVLAVLGSVGPVNAEAWLVDVNAHSANYTVALGAQLSGVKLGARHAITSYDAAGTNDGSTTRLDASAMIAGFGLKAMYLMTDKDGAAFVTDPSSANTYELSQFGAFSQNADADVYALGASYTMNSLTYAVDYAAGSEDVTDSDAEELRFRTTYKMSKNFTVMGTYSMYEVENAAGTKTTDNDSARLEAKYTF